MARTGPCAPSYVRMSTPLNPSAVVFHPLPKVEWQAGDIPYGAADRLGAEVAGYADTCAVAEKEPAGAGRQGAVAQEELLLAARTMKVKPQELFVTRRVDGTLQVSLRVSTETKSPSCRSRRSRQHFSEADSPTL